MKQGNINKSRVDRGWERMELLLDDKAHKKPFFFPFWGKALLLGSIAAIVLVSYLWNTSQQEKPVTEYTIPLAEVPVKNEIDNKPTQTISLNIENENSTNSITDSQENTTDATSSVKLNNSIKTTTALSYANSEVNENIKAFPDQSKTEASFINTNNSNSNNSLANETIAHTSIQENQSVNRNNQNKPIVISRAFEQIDGLDPIAKSMINFDYSNEPIGLKLNPSIVELSKSNSKWKRVSSIAALGSYETGLSSIGSGVMLKSGWKKSSVEISPFVSVNYLNSNLNVYDFAISADQNRVVANNPEGIDEIDPISMQMEDVQGASAFEETKLKVLPKHNLYLDVGLMCTKYFNKLGLSLGSGLEYYFKNLSLQQEDNSAFNISVGSTEVNDLNESSRFHGFALARVNYKLSNSTQLILDYKKGLNSIFSADEVRYNPSQLRLGIELKI